MHCLYTNIILYLYIALLHSLGGGRGLKSKRSNKFEPKLFQKRIQEGSGAIEPIPAFFVIKNIGYPQGKNKNLNPPPLNQQGQNVVQSNSGFPQIINK